MTMITPSYLGETIEYSSLHACRSTLEDPTAKDAAVFYFDTESGTTRDISSLDPNDTNRAVNSWGGLTDFSSQVGEIIARHATGDSQE